MPDRPFRDPARPPTEETLRLCLGQVYPCHASALALAVGFCQSWAYSKTSGWMLKVHRRNKALFYLIPLSGALRLSLAVREAERDALLADPRLALLHAALLAAPRASEGYSLFLVIEREAMFAPIAVLLEGLVGLRG